MDLEEFGEFVDARLDAAMEIDTADASHAVLLALSTRLTQDEATKLADVLPPSLARVLSSASGEQAFDRDAFIEDVAARLDLDDVEAERVAMAVLGAVRAVLEPGSAVEQVIEGLPADLAMLIHATD